MEGKIFGIPVIIVILALVIAALVDVPMFLINMGTQANLTALESVQGNTQSAVARLVPGVPVPTATPSATPIPAQKTVKQGVTISVPTTPVKVK